MSIVEKMILFVARAGRSECTHCGTFNKVGTPCRCRRPDVREANTK